MPSDGSASAVRIPWQVTILLRNPAYGVPEYKPFCGGVILDHKTILTSAQCFYGKEDCCTPKNSFEDNCQEKLFTDLDALTPCNGELFAQNADVFVTAGATTLYKDKIDNIGCNAFDALSCKQDPNIQVTKKLFYTYQKYISTTLQLTII